MSTTEKLSTIVRRVLAEADQYETPEDDAERYRNLGTALGLIVLTRLGLGLLAYLGIAWAGTAIVNASLNRLFNKIERLRADQRDGNLTLKVTNNSKYNLRVKSLLGGYYTTQGAPAPGLAAADSIMGTSGKIEIRKFFTEKPHESAVSLSVETMVGPGQTSTVDVPVESYKDTLTTQFLPSAARDAMEKAAEAGKYGPMKKKSPDYLRDIATTREKDTYDVTQDLGDAPFVAGHARVLIYDETGDALCILPVGLERNMQFVVVVDDKIARKAFRRQEREFKKIKKEGTPAPTSDDIG